MPKRDRKKGSGDTRSNNNSCDCDFSPSVNTVDVNDCIRDIVSNSDGKRCDSYYEKNKEEIRRKLKELKIQSQKMKNEYKAKYSGFSVFKAEAYRMKKKIDEISKEIDRCNHILTKMKR